MKSLYRRTGGVVSRTLIVYISHAMKSFSRHTFSVLALALYLIGGALIEIAHNDEANLLLESHPVLESHDCGAVEKHIAAENAHQCPACSLSNLRIATPTSSVLTLDANQSFIVVIQLHTEQLPETDVLHSGKRGPPQV